MNNTKEQYLKSWHDNFVSFISTCQAEVTVLLANPLIGEHERYYLFKYQEKLTSRDVQDIEVDLREGTIKVSTIAKLDKLNDDLVDIAWDHLFDSQIIRDTLKSLSRNRVQLYRNMTLRTINSLGIPIQQE